MNKQTLQNAIHALIAVEQELDAKSAPQGQPVNEVAPPTPSQAARATTLQNAMQAVMVDRNATHGNPEDNFTTIAAYLNTFAKSRGFETHFQNYDIATIMILMKASRLASSPDKQDHWTDVAGYASCGAGCVAATTGKPLRD